MTAIESDVLRLRNTATGEVVEVPLDIQERELRDFAGQTISIETTVRADLEGIPGGDYEALDDYPLSWPISEETDHVYLDVDEPL